MPDTKWNQFSVLQLKKWLEALGRQTSGTKAELIVRLQAISPETRGDSPPNNGSAAEEVEELDGDAAWPKQREPQGGDTRTIPFDEQSLQSESPENLDLDQLSLVDAERATLKKLRDEIEANMAVLQRIQADIDDANKSKYAYARQINDVIKNNSNGNHGNVNICANSTDANFNSTDANVNSTDANVNSTKVTIAADNIDTGHTSVGNGTAGSVVQHQSRNVNKLLESPATSLALAKEVTMEFDGSLCARNWVTQFQNIGKIYNLDDGCMHMLLIAKLKGNAQRWLHASATRILEPTDQLCEQLILTFEVKMSKGEMRNAFQKREWHPDEKFAAYFEDKVMLANDINIDLEELLENIIEGIPAPALRNQARIQCFSEPMQILRAFSEVRLPKHKTAVLQSSSSKRLTGGVAANKDLRCANCNSKGHFARECLKPKREPGSCYACGAFGHFVGQCPERKSANINNYLRSPVIPTPPRDLSVSTIIRIAQSQSSIPNRIQSPSPTMSIANKRASFARRAESLVERKYNISTEKCGDLTVIVQGDLSQQEKRAVFITVHDLGCNHNSFQEFVSSPCMTEIKERSCFIHVDVPGHADNAEALADGFPFPSLQSLGEDLVTVLDYLHVKYVIGLGEGAGANVLARFGLAHPSRVLGLILINATGSAASVVQSFKNKFISWKSDEVAQSAESFLMYHKFGHNWQIVGENPDKEKIVAEYQKRLHRSLNSKNIGLYVKAFMNRKDLTLKGCKVDVILITGMLSPYASMVEKLHRDVEKERVTILKIERAGDVLADAPGKVAQSILLFCKGQGLLTSVVMPGVDRGRAFSTASSGSLEGANGSRRLSRGISMEDYDKPNIRRLSIMNTKHIFSFNNVYMDAPPPTKPPRGVKYGKDESAGCGFLVNVIKSLGFSETTEERQKEKQKIEAEFKRSDLRLNELVSRHDQQLTQVLPLFSQVSSEVTASRERIHAVKENLGVCKRLLQCRRDELRKMWTDAVQHKYVLEMLEQIQELRKVPQRVVGYTAKRQYLHASKALTDALATLNGPLQAVEGLSDLRTDLQTRRQQLYQRLHEELVTQVYTNSANEALSSFQRTNSSRLNSSFTRGIGARRSTDRIEANARVRKALAEMAQSFDLDKAEVIEDADLIYPELSMSYFVAIIVESFGMLHKVPDSLETLRVQIQTELLNVVRHTTHQLSVSGATADTNPLLTLLEVIFKQFKAIAKTHSLLLKNYLSVGQKYSVVGPQPYDLTDFWAQAQSVLQLLLTDYLDIQNAAADESAQTGFSEPTSNINSYFLRRKVPSTKRSMFKFDKSSHVGTSSNSDTFKEHRRNASDASVDDNLAGQLGGSGKGSTSGLFPHEKKQREKILICTPDQSIITKVYLPLMGYIKEIENFMKCKPGQPCSLHDFLDNYIKDTFLSKGHNRNLQLTIESLSKNQDAWRTIISPEEIKALNLSRPLLQSTVMVERRLMETKNLIQDLPCYSEDLLKMVCALLKAYREICQAAYRGIVQPDSEDKRIYSVAWLKDEDISRFLKTLPNWTDLKTSSQKSRHNRKLHRGSFEPSEEESPLQVQQRNIREAEMLTSNLGEGGITQQEILVEISVLKELAILQESMEWFSCRVSEFANDLRRPLVNGLNAVPAECGADIAVKDGTIKVMTNLALEFDELANTCLLVLHLEVRVQCFHYLRSKSSVRTNSYVGSKDDILEPDRQVQVLTKRLSEMDEAFSATLHPRKTRYIFEGLAHLASRILIQASNYLEHIDQITVQRMCRNAIALQQTLSNITASREVALDQARHFYELLCMEPDEILNALLERGTQFSEMQLLNALQLSCKSFGITDANLLASYQQKLSDILGAKPSKGIVV